MLFGLLFVIGHSKMVILDSSKYIAERSKQFGSNVGDSEFQHEKNPSVVAQCFSAEDVAEAIRYAKSNNLKIGIKSGGHSYASLGSCKNCLQIDMQYMSDKYLSHDKTLLVVKPGIKNIDLVRYLLLHNTYVPHGLCYNVFLGGHYQTSASGALKGLYGMGLHSIKSFDMVLANETKVTFNHDHPYFKWLVGSAPGSFGVVTSYSIQTHQPSYENFSVRVYVYNLEKLQNVSIIYGKLLEFISSKQLNIIPTLNYGEVESLIGTFLRFFINYEFSLFRKTDVFEIVVMTYNKEDELMISSFTNELDRLRDFGFPYYYSSSYTFPNRLLFNTLLNIPYYYDVSGYSKYYININFDKPIPIEFFNELRKFAAAEDKIVYQIFPINVHNASFNIKHKDEITSTLSEVSYLIDLYVYYKTQDEFHQVKKRMEDFKENTKQYWLWADGKERCLWMGPQIFTNLKEKKWVDCYFPDRDVFHNVQAIKDILDPDDLFSTQGTIPTSKTLRSSTAKSL